MSNRPGITLFARIIPPEGIDHEEFADKIYNLETEEVAEGYTDLPKDFYFNIVQDGETDVYTGISGEDGQLCVTHTLVNDWCGECSTHEVYDKERDLITWLEINRHKEYFRYSIHIGASFG